MLDFSQQVKGGNFTPCLEKPEPVRDSSAKGIFQDVIIRKCAGRAAVYRKYLYPAIAAGRGLTRARLIAFNCMVNVALHCALSEVFPAGKLGAKVDFETTTRIDLFNVGVTEKDFAAIRDKVSSGDLLFMLREGHGASFPGCAESEADLLWEMEIVCMSARDDEPGEVPLRFCTSPLTPGQRKLAYQCFSYLKQKSQLRRLEAQRATLAKRDARHLLGPATYAKARRKCRLRDSHALDLFDPAGCLKASLPYKPHRLAACRPTLALPPLRTLSRRLLAWPAKKPHCQQQCFNC